MEAFLSICGKSGIQVIVPEHYSGMCCGQIFSSKGFAEAFRFTASKIVNDLWMISQKGLYPVVMDVSSCTHTLLQLRPLLKPEEQKLFDGLTIMDSVEFLHDYVLPRTTIVKKKYSITIHPVCSLEKMKTEGMFIQVAKHFAERVMVPKYAGCCGMAGDRGFLFPELTDSATELEAAEVKGNRFDGYYATTKTCEMAMSKAVGVNYESILYLVDEAL